MQGLVASSELPTVGPLYAEALNWAKNPVLNKC